EVHQLLAIDDREAPLFRLRRVDQHAFHVHSIRAACSWPRILESLRPRPLATIRCTRNAKETGRNRPGLREIGCGQMTAGPGSVGARETVRERIGSTLGITATQAEARGIERGA
ncbi:MAG: hypothetical protein ABI460_13000, partial [Caldimonas sp.]